MVDQADNYQFLYPFGWQEMSVATADVVYKDVVEPLESVSVTITDTDKGDITEFGEINEVRSARLHWLAAALLGPAGRAAGWAQLGASTGARPAPAQHAPRCSARARPQRIVAWRCQAAPGGPRRAGGSRAALKCRAGC